jgi:rhodanese-related sulfurtransferase
MRTTLFILFSMVFSAIFAQEGTKTNDTIYRTITPVQADSLITANAGNPDFIMIDVRTPGEYAPEHIINAININYYASNFDSTIMSLDHSKRYFIYCGSGTRSGFTLTKMENWHFKEVYNLAGGMTAWKNAGFPTTLTAGLSSCQKDFNPIYFENPVTTSLNVRISPGYSGTLRIYNISGSLAFCKESAANDPSVDVSGWCNGIYFLRFDCGNKVYTGKFIKQ